MHCVMDVLGHFGHILACLGPLGVIGVVHGRRRNAVGSYGALSATPITPSLVFLHTGRAICSMLGVGKSMVPLGHRCGRIWTPTGAIFAARVDLVSTYIVHVVLQKYYFRFGR